MMKMSGVNIKNVSKGGNKERKEKEFSSMHIWAENNLWYCIEKQSFRIT
jgi:hypothetical protein